MAKGLYKALQKDPADDKIRNTVNKINKILNQLNKRHSYPKDWIIYILLKPGVDRTGSAATSSSEAAASKGADKASKSSIKGSIKTKVAVPIPNESDSRISLGKVVYIRKVRHNLRVIVNRNTEENPYFDIYPRVAFGKGIAKK